MYVPFVRTSFDKNSFYFRCTSIWNSLFDARIRRETQRIEQTRHNEKADCSCGKMDVYTILLYMYMYMYTSV